MERGIGVAFTEGMNTMRKAGLLLVTALLAHGALACGDSVAFESDGGGGNGAGGSGGDGGIGGTGGGGGDDLCALYDDQSGSEVTFHIQNDTGQPIYLPTDCGILSPDIVPQGGPDQDTWYGNRWAGCFASCEDWQQSEPPVCTADACALTTLRLEAGASFDFVWAGTAMRQEEMPDQCWFDEQYASGECTRVLEAESQSYAFDLRAYSECVAEGQGQGACTCDETGQCFGQAGGLEGYHDGASFAHPDTATVNVVFGPCAFGCPDPQP